MCTLFVEYAWSFIKASLNGKPFHDRADLIRHCRRVWDEEITLDRIRQWYRRWPARLQRCVDQNGHVVNMKEGIYMG